MLRGGNSASENKLRAWCSAECLERGWAPQLALCTSLCRRLLAAARAAAVAAAAWATRLALLAVAVVVDEGDGAQRDAGPSQLQRGQRLAQRQVAAGRGKHGGEEGQAGEGGEVAAGGVVEEDAVAGGRAQQRHVEQQQGIEACTGAGTRQHTVLVYGEDGMGRLPPGAQQ